MLCTLLHSHPDIVCHHEIFNSRGIFLARDYDVSKSQLGSLEQRDQTPDLFLDSLWKYFSSNRCVGFKMTREQKELALKVISNQQNLKFILLYRNNRLKTYVSELIAEHLDQWEVYDHDDLIRNRPKVTVSASSLKSHARKNVDYMHEIKQALDSTHSVYMETTFEKLMSRDEHRRLIRFLGVNDGHALVHSSVKQSHADLRESISNYSELEQDIKGTEFERELYQERHV